MSDAREHMSSSTDSAALELMAEIDAAIMGEVSSQDVVVDLSTHERELGEGRDLFARLYVAYRPVVASQVHRYLNDIRDVDEVVQETFLRLLLALPDLETDGQVIAWCRRTATNMCIDRYRAAGRRPRLSPLDDMPAGFDAVYDSDPVTLAEDAAIVREALARLTPLHRQALVMREVEERSLPEIAAALSIPESTVKHVLHRARKSMRRLLADTPVARITAGFLVLAVALTGTWAGLRTQHQATPTVAALPAPALGALEPQAPVETHALTPAKKPTIVKKATVKKAAQIAPSTTLAAPMSFATARHFVPVPTPSIASAAFSYIDASDGQAVVAHQGQTAAWSDTDNGEQVVNALSEVDVPNIGQFLMSFSRAADTTSSASASVSMLINGHLTSLQVGRTVSSVQPQSDGTFIVAIDELLTGYDTQGNKVMAPRRLQVATRYAADLGNLIFSRLEISDLGNT